MYFVISFFILRHLLRLFVRSTESLRREYYAKLDLILFGAWQLSPLLTELILEVGEFAPKVLATSFPNSPFEALQLMGLHLLI